MNFNTKIRYGIRAMIELALNGNNAVLQKDIALNQGISVKYLDHIIAPLKTAGLIHTIKGKGSGYVLSKPAGEISLLEIFRAFDSKFVSIDCIEGDGHSCKKESFCGARYFWYDLNESIEDYLSKIKLQSLAEKENEFREKKNNIHYNI